MIFTTMRAERVVQMQRTGTSHWQRLPISNHGMIIKHCAHMFSEQFRCLWDMAEEGSLRGRAVCFASML